MRGCRSVVVAAVAVVLLASGCSDTKPDCKGDAVVCGSSCVELKSDNLNCGACGTTCAAGKVCSNSACAVTCASGLVNCGGKCVDPATDRAFCGASATCAGPSAGTACSAGQVCSAGACALTCQVGLVNCGGTCVDPLKDPRYCGADLACGLGQTCAAGNACDAGQCVLSCQTGLVNCGGKCVDPKTDRSFCGASATCTGADGGVVCAAGQICSGGACATTCPAGEFACGGKCVDPKSDPNYCGSTSACAGGAACGPGAACYAGLCEPLCAAGQVMCGGSCIDPLTSAAFCGASGYCSGPSAGVACAAGLTCQGGTCVCTWTQVWLQSLASLPAGATARSGALGGWGFSTVAGRTAFTTTSDWAELLFPASVGAGDDTFAVQADFYASAVTLGTGGFRSTGLYALTDLYNSGQRYGVWAGFREQAGQATQFQWVVSPAALPTSGWDGWDIDLVGISSLAQSTPAALLLGGWHTLRVEGVRSQCRFRALLDGLVVSTWTPATCDLAGASVAVAAARASPLNVAWTNLAVYKGSAAACIP